MPLLQLERFAAGPRLAYGRLPDSCVSAQLDLLFEVQLVTQCIGGSSSQSLCDSCNILKSCAYGCTNLLALAGQVCQDLL